MDNFIQIVLALIEQLPWFTIISLVFMFGKFGYRHFFCKVKDLFEVKIDK